MREIVLGRPCERIGILDLVVIMSERLSMLTRAISAAIIIAPNIATVVPAN